MRQFTATQKTIVSSSYKLISWLFNVKTGATTYYWSTKSKTWSGHNYSTKIASDAFDGIVMRRAKTYEGDITPTETSFRVMNTDGSLTASDFDDAEVTVSLVISDGTSEEEIRSWKFMVKRCEAVYGELQFECVDIFQYLLDGEYPNHRMIREMFKSSDPDYAPINDLMVPPLVFGTAFVPLRSFATASSRYYCLGPTPAGSSNYATYGVVKVRAPAQAGFSEWYSSSYTMQIAEKTAKDGTPIASLKPIVIDSDEDGTPDGIPLWTDGQYFQDMPAQFWWRKTKAIGGKYSGTVTSAGLYTMTDSSGSWGTTTPLKDFYVVNKTDKSYVKISSSDGTHIYTTDKLAGGTNNQWQVGDSYRIGGPASVIRYVLSDIGSQSTWIDDDAFGGAEQEFADRGLEWNGGLYYKEDRRAILSNFAEMCNGTFVISDKIELHSLSTAAVATIDNSLIVKDSDVGRGSFSYEPITKYENDSAHIAFQYAGEPQNQAIKVLVPLEQGGTTDNIASETIPILFVSDSQNAQRLGTLHYQRKHSGIGSISVRILAKGLKLDPDDIVVISGTYYGGTLTKCVIDEIRVSHDLALDLSMTKYDKLSDWGDLTPTGITIASGDYSYTYSPVYSGPNAGTPSGGNEPNKMAGKLIVGDSQTNYVLIDGDNKLVQSSNYTSGVSGFYMDPDRAEFGNVAVRGIFRTAVFQKDVISAVGGSLAIRPSDVLSASMSCLDASSLKIEGNETFAVGDILRIKDSTDDEWMSVSSASGATYTVTRDKAGSYGADSNPNWKKGATVVNYGQSGDGWIYLTSSDTNAPYLSMNTHSGSPWTDAVTKLRLGNLNGYLGYVSDVYGLGVGEFSAGKANITLEPTNGLRMRSYTTTIFQIDNSGNAYLGNCEINGSLSVSDDIVLGTSGAIYSSGKTYFGDPTAGFFLGYQGNPYWAYTFDIGDSSDYFRWDGTKILGNFANGSSSQITVGNTDGVWVNSTGSMVVSGNLYLSSGGTFNANSGSTMNINSGANMYIGSGGSLTIQSSGDMTIDSGGKLTVNATQGIYVGSSGSIYLVGAAGGGGKIDLGGAGGIYYDTTTSTVWISGGSSGTLHIQQYDGTDYSDITVNGGSLYIYSTYGGNYARIDFASSSGKLYLGATTNIQISSDVSYIDPQTTNTIDLGTSSYKFKDLYLSGNIDVDSTSWIGLGAASARLTFSSGQLDIDAANLTLDTGKYIGLSATDCLEFTSTSAFQIKGVYLGVGTAPSYALDVSGNSRFQNRLGVGGIPTSDTDLRVYTNSTYPVVVRSGATNLLIMNSSGDATFYGDVKAGADGSGAFYCRGTVGVSWGPGNPTSVTVKGGIVTAIS